MLHNIDNPLERGIPGRRQRRAQQRALPHAEVHSRHPPAQPDGRAARQPRWRGRAGSPPAAKRVYPKQISFNQDYNAPKFKRGKPLDFVKHLGQIGAGPEPARHRRHVLLGVRLVAAGAAGIATRAKPATPSRAAACPRAWRADMKPMRATGDYITRRGRYSNAGLAEGPLLVVDTLEAARSRSARSCCTRCSSRTRSGMAKMSVGHKTLAERCKPKFAPLEKYYLGVGGKWGPTMEARFISTGFKRGIPENYSPTSFLINTLLPRQQRQPDHGLRRDHRDRIAAPRKVAATRADCMDRRQLLKAGLAWPLRAARAAPVAKDPIYIGDMHFHLFFFGPQPGRLQALGQDHGRRQRDARRLVAGRRSAVDAADARAASSRRACRRRARR